jgi:serine/threonine protein kinase
MQTPGSPAAVSPDSDDFEAQTIRVSAPESKGENFERPDFAAEYGEKRGDFIGPYKLLEQIGEGGFGSVWRAEQTKPVHREVAVKLIKAGMDSREIIGRFEAERQALAMMDHPNIARMLDGGTTTSGRPYFAMEFVKGVPVNEFCDGRKLSLNDRIGIFIDICSAVQHAHQKAILHRDLKPSNIIVSENGGRIVPKVIDFGVAKALGQQLSDKTMFTAMGLAIGTPQYMSPEQAGATYQDIDTRSDVYSLGVILYELLTGSTPLTRDEVKKLMMHQLMEVLRTKEAERPSTRFQHMDEATRQQVAASRHVDFIRLQKHLRGDLDWVVMRALEKDRNRRYQTVNALALDLQRYLKGEPVEAGPPSASYRLGKMAKRYRGPLIAAGLVAASIVAGLCFTVWQAVRATKAEKLASDRLGEAQKARDAAESLINEAIYGLRKKLMAVGKVEVMEEMVTSADNYYRRLPVELLKDDETQRHLASIALNRAIIAGATGNDEEYEKQTREALRITEELAKKHPDEEKLQDEACYAMLNLCYLFMDRNDNKSLVPMADMVVARCENWLKNHPKAIWAMRYEVLAHNVAAQALIRYLKKVPEGMQRFQTATQITQKMREIGGETAEVCECEGFIHYGNANAAERMGLPGVNVIEFEKSTAAFARALELGGDSALLREMHVGAMHHAGIHGYHAAKAKNDAEGMKRGLELVEQAFEGRRKLVELEPGRAEWWRDLAYSYRVQAGFARGRQDITTELELRKEELRCRDEAVKRQPNRPMLYDERGAGCAEMASALLLLDPPDIKQSAALTLRSIEDWKHTVEAADNTALTGRSLKSDIDRLGKLAETDPAATLPALTKAREMIEPLFGKVEGGDLAGTLSMLYGRLRVAYAKLGRDKEAQEMENALGALPGRDSTPLGKHQVGQTLYDQARTEYDKANSLPQDQRAEALAKVEAQRLKAHALLEQAAGKDPANTDFRGSLGSSWRLKAMIERALNQKREAIADYQKSATAYDTVKHGASIIDSHKDAADVLRELKDYQEAAAAYQRAAKLADERLAQLGDKASGGELSRASSCWSGLGGVQISLNNVSEGLKSLDEALKRRQRANAVEPANRNLHWDLITLEMEIMIQRLRAKQSVPPVETAVPHLKDLASLLKDETDHGRLQRLNDTQAGQLHSLLRDQKRLPEATVLLRHLIAIRQRMETLKGWPTDLAKLSFGARASLVALLTEQQLTAEAATEEKALLTDAESSGSPMVQAEVHDRLWSWLSGLRKYAESEAHARAAHDLAQKNDLGWRGISYSSNLGSALVSQQKNEEAEKILLAAWEKAAKQTWPGEPLRLRGDLAIRLSSVYHNMHMKQPDAARDTASRVWIARAAEQCPLEKFTNESEFNHATQHWLGWLAQLADEGRVDEYQKQRSAFLQAAKPFTAPNSTLERVARAALLLPLQGDDLKRMVEGAAKAYQSNSNDEWLRLTQCLALVRSGKAAEALATAQPMLKTGDNTRYCLIQPIVALAHRQLGQHAESDAIIAALDKDSYRMKHIQSPTQRDAIIARVLLNEARKK